MNVNFPLAIESNGIVGENKWNLLSKGPGFEFSSAIDCMTLANPVSFNFRICKMKIIGCALEQDGKDEMR